VADQRYWQINVTRDTSQDAEVVVEAETAAKAGEIFLHDMDRDAITWRDGDWLCSDTEIVEILEAAEDAETTLLDASQKKPGPDVVDLQTKELVDIARQIHRILEDNDTSKGRFLLDTEDIVMLRGLADRLGVVARELSTA
jgi:hypothetical protein